MTGAKQLDDKNPQALLLIRDWAHSLTAAGYSLHTKGTAGERLRGKEKTLADTFAYTFGQTEILVYDNRGFNLLHFVSTNDAGMGQESVKERPVIG